jgi:hypothetical protein
MPGRGASFGWLDELTLGMLISEGMKDDSETVTHEP